ncbi:FUSC family protein [Streptomyces sp. NPDC002044]|uniref:FUSC family protein n=1 Tax=Streptomyces sp. NPDC002044 TaxID=3154662 RepID=UPI003332BDAA
MDASGVARRAGHSLRGLWGVYLSREASARFDVHLALGTAVMVGVPVMAGAATGRSGAAVVFTLAAFLTSLAAPAPDPAGRVRQFAFRVAMLTAAHAVGMLTSGNLWATAAVSAVAALLVPLPGVGITPMIVLVTGATPQPGLSPGAHLLVFAAGGLWAALILLTPFVGGRYGPAPAPPPAPAAGDRRSPRAAVVAGDPQVRYAVRLCLCFTAAYIALGLLAVPHAAWALIGILTTLRPTWGATRSRVVKRLTGTAAGCALTALLLALTPGSPFAQGIVVTALAAVARPVREFNYGFWPVFGTPLLLLITDFDRSLGWVDLAERMGNNMLGALLATAATLLMWPAREEGRIPQRVATLLDTHARFVERVATIVEFGPPLEREYRVNRAEEAESELRAARARLATRRGAAPELLDDLESLCGAAARLRAGITAHRPYERARVALDPAELRLCARLLREATVPAALPPEDKPPGAPPGPGPTPGPEPGPETELPLTRAAHALVREALAASGTAVRLTRATAARTGGSGRDGVSGGRADRAPER